MRDCTFVSTVITGLLWVLPIGLACASEAAGHGDAHGHGASLGFILSLFFNFIAFVLLLFFLLKKPVSGFFATRSKEVEDQLAAADRRRAEAEAKIKEYGSKIDELMATRDEVLQKAKKEAAYERECLLDQARRQAESIVEDAQRSIDVELGKAEKRFRTEAIKTIAEEAERLLKTSLNEEDTVRMADDYIEMLREVKRA